MSGLIRPESPKMTGLILTFDFELTLSPPTLAIRTLIAIGGNEIELARQVHNIYTILRWKVVQQ